jgi:hypothetical protein
MKRVPLQLPLRPDEAFDIAALVHVPVELRDHGGRFNYCADSPADADNLSEYLFG